ncbi:MAG: RNA 2',3'-cyclic phosphodiesterase [Desulfosudaceae bacterium]
MSYNAGQNLRTFLAFDLPPEATRRVAEIQRDLAGHGLKMKWVRPENVHLTIKFLGNVPVAELEKVAEAAADIAGRAAPMSLRLKGLGVFPGIKRPNVLWTGLTGDNRSLIEFHDLLEAALAEAGFEKDRRAFKAHLTIARIKSPVDPRLLAEAMEVCGQFPETELPARQLTLYKSELRPSGAVYTVLQQFPLSG